MSVAVDVRNRAPDAVDRSRAWLTVLPFLALGLAASVVPFLDAGRRLLDLWWNNGSYGHGLVVLPVTLYLLWLRRGDFARETPSPSMIGLVLLSGLMAAWLVSRLLGIVMGEQLAMVLAPLALVHALLGFPVARLAALPLLYLFCAVPIWSYLVPLLQDNTAVASATMARWLGVPIYLEGLYMTIPDGQFLVAEVCSGLRYLLAALSLSAFYALLNLHSTWARVAVVLAGFAIGLVFNWVRVVGIVLAGHYSRMESYLVTNHIEYGWGMFLLVVILIIALGRLLEWLEGPPPEAAATSSASAPRRRRSGWIAPAAGVIAVLLAPAAMASYLLAEPDGSFRLALAEPDTGSRWELAGSASDGWRPVYMGASAEQQSRFSGGEDTVDLFLAYYPVQRQDAEVVNDDNRAFDRALWEQIDLTAVPRRIEAAPGVPAAEVLIQRLDRKAWRMVWRTWWINGEFTADPVRAKYLQVLGMLFGRPQAAAVLVSAPMESPRGDEKARENLREFLAQSLPAVTAVLEGAAAAGR